MKEFNFSKKPSNSRPLKVGEEIRHALSDIFMRGEIYDPQLSGKPLTVSEVRMSPDLKNATAYVMPLGGENKEGILEALVRVAPAIRAQIASRVTLRHVPRIWYKLDESYEEANRINKLLKQPEVLRDIEGK